MNVHGTGGEGRLNMYLFWMEKDVFILWMIRIVSSGIMSANSLVCEIIFKVLDDISSERYLDITDYLTL